MPSRIDMTGMRFGRLLVVSFSGKTTYGHVLWLCDCDCGQKKIVSACRLSNGNTSSCGCLRRERAKTFNKSHGLTHSSTYMSWSKAKRRCYYPKHQAFKLYGGAGIEMCDRWKNSFSAFLEDMGHRPKGKTLDRINNSKGYEPENCRWATPKEQVTNSRRPKLLTYNGETHNYTEWEVKLGFSRGLLFARIRTYKWTVERALTEKPRKSIRVSQR